DERRFATARGSDHRGDGLWFELECDSLDRVMATVPGRQFEDFEFGAHQAATLLRRATSARDPSESTSTNTINVRAAAQARSCDAVKAVLAPRKISSGSADIGLFSFVEVN